MHPTFTLTYHQDLNPVSLSLSLYRKAASAQQPVGFVSVSERRQPQRERPGQDGPCPAHPDLCHCSDSPAHHAGPPPLLSTCKSLTRSVVCMPSPCVWIFIQSISSQTHKHTEEMMHFDHIWLALDDWTSHRQPPFFFCVHLPGLSVELCRERGQPVRDQANPRLPALALHPVG